MPRPKDLDRYPPQFLQLAKQFEGNPTVAITVPVHAPETPQSLRLALNAFRAALKESDQAAHFPYFLTSEFRCEEHALVIIAKEQTPLALAVGKALKKTSSLFKKG